MAARRVRLKMARSETRCRRTDALIEVEGEVVLTRCETQVTSVLTDSTPWLVCPSKKTGVWRWAAVWWNLFERESSRFGVAGVCVGLGCGRRTWTRGDGEAPSFGCRVFSRGIDTSTARSKLCWEEACVFSVGVSPLLVLPGRRRVRSHCVGCHGPAQGHTATWSRSRTWPYRRHPAPLWMKGKRKRCCNALQKRRRSQSKMEEAAPPTSQTRAPGTWGVWVSNRSTCRTLRRRLRFLRGFCRI